MGNRKFGFFDLLSFDLVFNLKSQRLTWQLRISDATASSSVPSLDFSVMKTCSYLPLFFPGCLGSAGSAGVCVETSIFGCMR